MARTARKGDASAPALRATRSAYGYSSVFARRRLEPACLTASCHAAPTSVSRPRDSTASLQVADAARAQEQRLQKGQIAEWQPGALHQSASDSMNGMWHWRHTISDWTVGMFCMLWL